MLWKMSYILLWNVVLTSNICFTLLKQIDEILVTQDFSDMDYFLRIMSACEFDLVKIVTDYVSSALSIRANLV